MNMDPSNADCEIYSNVNDTDDPVVLNVQTKLQNQQPNKPSGIKCEFIAEKSELENILRTVSLLCPYNSKETAGPSKENECEIIWNSSKDSDSDDLQILDVIINRNHAKKISSEKLHNVNSVNKLPKECLKSSKNMSDVSVIQEIQNKNDSCKNITNSTNIPEVQNINVNDICESNTESIDSRIIQNVNDINKNMTNLVDIHKASNETAINENIEILPEKVSNDNPYEVSASEFADNSESISVSHPETDFASVNNIMDTTDVNCNSSEKSIEENTINIEVVEHKNVDYVTLCDEDMDITDEINENCEIEYDFNPAAPLQITGSWSEFIDKKNNYTRGCKWAPDGSCIMTCSDDNKLRIFNMPSQLWDYSQWSNISEMEAVLRISEGDLIYDYCWYPLMNSNDPSTCCLVSTSRKNTVHMWDAYSGELRCSYRSFNHLDELVTPYSVCFDSDGEKLFCGFKNTVRVFDINRPGRIFEERQIYTYKTGQCGIISCFAFTSADKHISAAGSYQKSIGLYAEPYGELSCLLEGQGSGITHLQFSPDGKYLYSGGRKDSEILCWDLRNSGSVLFSLRRTCNTNQRMYFDISRCGKYVVSGNQNGIITFWDVTTEPKVIEKSYYPVLVPIRFYLAHDDCVNGVNFHPSHPLLCSSSGQRKIAKLLDDDSENIFSDIKEQDNSLRLWWLGKSNQ